MKNTKNDNRKNSQRDNDQKNNRQKDMRDTKEDMCAKDYEKKNQ